MICMTFLLILLLLSLQPYWNKQTYIPYVYEITNWFCFVFRFSFRICQYCWNFWITTYTTIIKNFNLIKFVSFFLFCFVLNTKNRWMNGIFFWVKVRVREMEKKMLKKCFSLSQCFDRFDFDDDEMKENEKIQPSEMFVKDGNQ